MVSKVCLGLPQRWNEPVRWKYSLSSPSWCSSVFIKVREEQTRTEINQSNPQSQTRHKEIILALILKELGCGLSKDRSYIYVSLLRKLHTECHSGYFSVSSCCCQRWLSSSLNLSHSDWSSKKILKY